MTHGHVVVRMAVAFAALCCMAASLTHGVVAPLASAVDGSGAAAAAGIEPERNPDLAVAVDGDPEQGTMDVTFTLTEIKAAAAEVCLQLDDGALFDACLGDTLTAHLTGVPVGWHLVAATLHDKRDGTRLASLQTPVLYFSATSTGAAALPIDVHAVLPQYWKSLCPGLSIGDEWPDDVFNRSVHVDDAPATRHGPSDTPSSRMRQSMERDGYFVSPDGINWGLPYEWDALATCVGNLRRHRWPGVFVLVFDEAWMMLSRVHSIMRDFLGPETVMMPDIWVHVVDYNTAHEGTGEAEPAGWGPHRDRPWSTYQAGTPHPDRLPHLTVWVPLTRALADNGAMYIIPKSRDPVFDGTGQTKFSPTFKVETQGLDFRAVRAMPAVPGQIVGWDGEVAHWGARSHADAPHSRISMTLDFVETHDLARRLVWDQVVSDDSAVGGGDAGASPSSRSSYTTFEQGVNPTFGTRLGVIHVSVSVTVG